MKRYYTYISAQHVNIGDGLSKIKIINFSISYSNDNPIFKKKKKERKAISRNIGTPILWKYRYRWKY